MNGSDQEGRLTMKTQDEIIAKIADLEAKLQKETEYSEGWWSVCNKIIALRWVVQK